MQLMDGIDEVLAVCLRSGGILGRKVISVQCGNGACHPPEAADEKKILAVPIIIRIFAF